MKINADSVTTYRSAYAVNDPLRGVFRAVSDPIAAGMTRRVNLGYPDTRGAGRSGVAEGVELLRTVALPGPSTLHLGRGDANADGARIAAALLGTLAPGRGGLLDLGDAAAGAEQTFVTRQVTLTDFFAPEAERAGSLVLTLRHPMDVNAAAAGGAPPGRDHRAVEAAWYDLSEVAAVAVNRMDDGGVRPSLVSLSFLAAARWNDYPDRAAAEAVRAHVVANYGCRRTAERLDRFAACLSAMVRCRAFPHRLMGVLGGLLSSVSQREIASATVVVRGPQEGVKTDATDAPRSSVNVPACAYLDLDKEIRLAAENGCAGVALVYAVFVYTQRLGREGVRLYVMRSRLNGDAFREGLGVAFARLRANNAIAGGEGASAPPPPAEAPFPLLRLYADRRAERCPPARLASRGATSRLFPWKPDLRGRPNSDSCLFAAYCRLGHLDDLSRVQRRCERFGSVDAPVVSLHGMVWGVGQWVECCY